MAELPYTRKAPLARNHAVLHLRGTESTTSLHESINDSSLSLTSPTKSTGRKVSSAFQTLTGKKAKADFKQLLTMSKDHTTRIKELIAAKEDLFAQNQQLTLENERVVREQEDSVSASLETARKFKEQVDQLSREKEQLQVELDGSHLRWEDLRSRSSEAETALCTLRENSENLVEVLASEIQQLGLALKKSQKETQKALGEIKRSSSTNDQLKIDNATLQNDLQEQAKKYASMEDRYQSENRRSKLDLEDQIQRLIKEKENLREELSGSRLRGEDLAGQNIILKARSANAEAALHTIQASSDSRVSLAVKESQRESQEALVQLKLISDTNHQLRTDNATLQNKLQEQITKCARLEDQYHLEMPRLKFDMQDQIKRLTREKEEDLQMELNGSRLSRDNLARQTDNSKEALQVLRDNSDSRVRALNAEIHGLNLTVKDSQREAQTTLTQMKRMSDTVDQLKADNAALQDKLKEQEKKYYSLEGQYTLEKRRLMVALEICQEEKNHISARLNCAMKLVCSAKRGIDELEELGDTAERRGRGIRIRAHDNDDSSSSNLGRFLELAAQASIAALGP